MQSIKNRKLKIIQRDYLTELKNIDKIVNDDKFILRSGRRFCRYLANKIGTNIITDRRRQRLPFGREATSLPIGRVFIVGVYSSVFLQRLINKYLNKNSRKLRF